MHGNNIAGKEIWGAVNVVPSDRTSPGRGRFSMNLVVLFLACCGFMLDATTAYGQTAAQEDYQRVITDRQTVIDARRQLMQDRESGDTAAIAQGSRCRS